MSPIKSEEIKPYEIEGAKKEQVSAMFNNIAGYYDLLNRFLSLGIDRRWRKRAVAMLRDHQPQHILDIATGTADLAIEAQKQLQAQSIIGIDISAKMLEIGRQKLTKKGLDGVITLEEADSEALPFEDNRFDALMVAFGVRNFANVEKGLAEMLRVLKPGGACLILEFSKPRVFPFKQGFQFYFKYILPTIGRLTSKDKKAYSYLYESVQAFPEGSAFVEVLTQLGLKDVQCQSLSLNICSAYLGFKPQSES